jgi:hypothetical protein
MWTISMSKGRGLFGSIERNRPSYLCGKDDGRQSAQVGAADTYAEPTRFGKMSAGPSYLLRT